MGWENNCAESISATEVIKVISAERYHSWDQGAAANGKIQHKQILDSLNEQITPTLPGFSARSTAVDIPDGQMMSREQTISMTMSDSVQLRVAPDAVIWDGSQLSCLEIKPSLSDYHLLQLMYGCMAANELYAEGNGGAIQGLLYLYRNTVNVKILQNGGREHWEAGKRIAVLASELRAKEDSSPMKVADLAITNPKERAVYYRREMDQVWGSVARGLRASLS